MECLELNPPQTRFYKLLPGVDRLFNFKVTPTIKAPVKLAAGGNKKGGEGQDEKIKQQDAKIANLRNV